MKHIDSAMLAEMAIRILERTAMVLAEPADSGQNSGAPMRFAQITFSGENNGTLTLGATDGFLCEVAASLLGVEPSEVDVQTHGCDALREIANILGGSVILSLSGETCNYSLNLPQLVNAPPESSATDCTVIADGGTLRLMLSTCGAAA